VRALAVGLVVAVLFAGGGLEAASKLKAGDIATVKAEKTAIKEGRTVLAWLKKGQRIKVYNVHEEGGFALVYFKVKGKLRQGYVAVGDLEAPRRGETKKLKAVYVKDDIVVTTIETKLMLGKKVLGTVPKGRRLTIQKVKGDWLGVTTRVDGKDTGGWVKAKHVTYASLSDDAKKDSDREWEKKSD
jgi:TusA-related sulfurtransferase